jgi:hypothetical protein
VPRVYVRTYHVNSGVYVPRPPVPVPRLLLNPLRIFP